MSPEKKRLLKIEGDKIYFTKDNFISFSETNLKNADFRVRNSGDIYWEVEVIKFINSTGELFVKVTDYYPNNATSFNGQKQTKQVNFIDFGKLEWSQFEPQLSIYSEFTLKDLIENTGNFDLPSDTKEDLEENFYFEENEKEVNETKDIVIRSAIEPQLVTMKEEDYYEEIDTKPYLKTYTINYPYRNTEFCKGYVLINTELEDFYGIMEIKIYNSDILPEFNHIKSYFPKVFKSKTFDVTVEVEIKGDDMNVLSANSSEIESIDNGTISAVKQRKVKEAFEFIPEPNEPKSLFTLDELLSKTSKSDDAANILKQSEDDIFKILFTIKKVRNRKQLEYLSGYKHSNDEIIRFTLNPIFGFVFSIQGETMNHYCWELLDSHATYLWSIEKSEKPIEQIKRIEETLSLIKEIGRQKYKTAFKQRKIDTEILFNTINHKKNQSRNVDIFVVWKHRLESFII